MRVLVAFTGGTIGSCVSKTSVTLDNSTKYTLLSCFENREPAVEFEVSTPYSILSENLSAKELNLLQKEIEKNIHKDYDGIIVTHGTDTLQYAATVVEYAFCNSRIPIVFVSADYPLENPKTNGFANFEAAIEFIRAKRACGVFVAYRNAKDDFTSIHIPSRLLCHSECCADLHSIDDKPFARYTDKIEFCGCALSEKVKPSGVVQYAENSEILCISGYPGNGYAYALEQIKAIIFNPYHSATLDTANAQLKAFCKRAAEKGIPVFVVNVKEGIRYDSTNLFDEMNITVLPYSTFVSAYVKTWMAISLGENIREFVFGSIAHEFIV